MPASRCTWTPGPRTTPPRCATAARVDGRPRRRHARQGTGAHRVREVERQPAGGREDLNNKRGTAWKSHIVLIVIAVIFVRPGHQGGAAAERLGGRAPGQVPRTLTPGLNFLVPFVDKVAYKHSLKEIPLDVPSQVCITRDNTQLQVDGILYFQVTDPMRASYGSSNYIVAVTQLAQTSLRSVIGKLELDKTFEERDIINAQVVQAIDEAALNWGVKVLRYEIKDLTPPKEILHAMQAADHGGAREARADRRLRRPAPGADQHRHRRARGLHRPLRGREAGRDQQGPGRGGGDHRRGRSHRGCDPQGGRGHPPAGWRAGGAVESGRTRGRRLRQGGRGLHHHAGDSRPT